MLTTTERETYSVTIGNSITHCTLSLRPASLCQWHRGMHSHAVYELHYVIGGSVTVRQSDGQPSVLGAQTLCLIPPLCEHCFDPSPDGQKLALRLSPEQGRGEEDVYSDYRAALLSVGTPLFFFDAEIADILQRMLQLVPSGAQPFCEAERRACVAAHLTELLPRLFRAVGRRGTNRSDIPSARDTALLRQLEGYLARHYDAEVTLSSVADALHFSPRHIERTCRSGFGLSFHDLLQRQRMTVIRQKMSEGNIPLRRIAEECGYSSYAGFYRAFCRCFGSSPRELYKKTR